MTIAVPPTETRCTSYSKSRARYCLAYGRYECRNDQCAHRACGLHVVRNDRGIYCPQCSGPVRTSKL
jgi:predicted nucleic acid-binding Zn ribbon protein